MATEDALNKAAEARKACEKLINRMHDSDDGDASYALTAGDNVQSVGGLRQFEYWLTYIVAMTIEMVI